LRYCESDMDTSQDIRDIAPLLIEPSRVTDLMVDEYVDWFFNGSDFNMQHPYMLPADLEGSNTAAYLRVEVPLRSEHVRRHLEGHHTIGCYALAPGFSSCKWMALDVDYDMCDGHLDMIAKEMEADGLSPALEDSRRGGHIWVLFATPIPGSIVRTYLYNLLDSKGFAIRGERGKKEGVEIFPKQSTLAEGSYGNGLRGPLGIHRKAWQRFWFRAAAPNIEDQFKFLRWLPRASYEHMESLTEGLSMPDDCNEVVREQAVEWQDSNHKGREFDVRNYLQMPRRWTRGRKGLEGKIQCPSCAEAGKDRGRDNLSITNEKGKNIPSFICFAGCPRIAVIEACKRRPRRNS